MPKRPLPVKQSRDAAMPGDSKICRGGTGGPRSCRDEEPHLPPVSPKTAVNARQGETARMTRKLAQKPRSSAFIRVLLFFIPDHKNLTQAYSHDKKQSNSFRNFYPFDG